MLQFVISGRAESEAIIPSENPASDCLFELLCQRWGKRYKRGGLVFRPKGLKPPLPFRDDLVCPRAGLGSIACPETRPERIDLRLTGLGIAEVLLQVFGHADPEVEHGRARAQIDASGKGCQVSHLRIVARRN